MAEKINIIVTPEALEGLKVAIERVEKLKDFIDKTGKPSANEAYTASLKQQALETKNLTDAIIKNEKAETAKINKEKASIALSEAKRKANEAIAESTKKVTKAKEEENSAYNKVLEKQRQAVKELRDLVTESGKAENSNRNFTREINNQKTALDKLNAELLEAEHATKKYGFGASSSATPVLAFVEAQKKAAQATKELNAEAKSAIANERLSRSYVQLSNSREQAKNKLQDLIASQTASTAQVRQAQREFDVLNRRVQQADRAVGRFSQSNNSMGNSLRGVTNLMGAFGISTGLYLGASIVKNIYETTKQLQSLDLALKMVGGTEQEFAENKVFITDVAEKWGLEIKSLQQTYTQFYTASKGLLSDESIKTTFEGIAKAGSIMGLSLEKQQAAFYAIDQMMSKGTVTAEELKKQLGNAMPGAIKAAAMAYMELHPQIKSIQEAEEALYKDMKKGAIDSATYVPLIAKNFQILYGIEALEEVNTMQSAQNRLKNGYTEWIKELTSGNSVTNKAVTAVNWLAKNIGTLLNIVLKGGTVLGFYLGITKAYSFVTREAFLITEAFAIAKRWLSVSTTQNIVETQREIAVRVLQTAATRGQTVATTQATVATRGLSLAMLSNPFGVIIALIGATVTAYLLLRDTTDDATASLMKYEKAKRDAEKQAVKDVKAISKDKNAFQERLEIEVRQLNQLRDIQKTANGAELKEINERIVAKKADIELTKEKLRLEGINVKEKSKEASDTAYVASHKAGAERDSLQLKRLNKQEELDKALKFISTKEGIANFDVVKRRIEFLRRELETIQQQIRDKNVEITKQNKIFNELRPDKITKPTGGNGDGDGDGTERKAKTQAEIDAETKAEADRLKAIADSLKLDYDLALSNAERKKELIEDELNAFKGSVQQKIQLSMKLALAENEINKIKLKESKRVSKGDTRLIGIAENEEFKAQGDSIQNNLKRIGGYWSDYFKSLDNMPDTIFGDKFKLTPEQEEELKNYNEKIKAELKATRDVFNSFAGDFADNLGIGDTFDLLLNPDKDGNTLFEKLKKDEATWKAYALAITTVMQDAYNFINQQSQARFDAEHNRLEEQRKIGLKNAGDSASAKEKIELDYEKKQKEIQKREAKAKKKQAVFNIAIDTAQAAMSSWAKTGFPWMAAAAIAMGAAQAAMVIAKKIPEYWTGTDNAKDGLALTQERGAEIITDRKGKIKTFGSHKGAVLTRMQSGDKVFNAEESKRMMFENEYRLKATTTNTNNGMTADEMRLIMVDTLGGRPTLNMNFDKGGFGSYISKNGNITRQSESRGSGRGIEV